MWTIQPIVFRFLGFIQKRNFLLVGPFKKYFFKESESSLDETRQYQISSICRNHREIAEKWVEELAKEQKYYRDEMKKIEDESNQQFNDVFSNNMISA